MEKQMVDGFVVEFEFFFCGRGGSVSVSGDNGVLECDYLIINFLKQN